MNPLPLSIFPGCHEWYFFLPHSPELRHMNIPSCKRAKPYCLLVATLPLSIKSNSLSKGDGNNKHWNNTYISQLNLKPKSFSHLVKKGKYQVPKKVNNFSLTLIKSTERANYFPPMI